MGRRQKFNINRWKRDKKKNKKAGETKKKIREAKIKKAIENKNKSSEKKGFNPAENGYKKVRPKQKTCQIIPKTQTKEVRRKSENNWFITREEAEKFPILVLTEGKIPNNGRYAVKVAKEFLIVKVEDEKIIRAKKGTSSYLADLCQRMDGSFLPVWQVFLPQLDMPTLPKEKFDAIVAFWHRVKNAVVAKADVVGTSQKKKPIAAV